ncbi:MAG: hypothetical protein K9N21_08240 [Deltaproteobacteria bacterium]|nr:hypothetical protein [Deltaproteobacteria bacterium]
MARTIAFILEAVVVMALGTIFSQLPKTIVSRLSAVSGTVLFRLDRKDRKRAYHNLDIMFSEAPLSPFEKARIVKGLFKNIAALAFEYLQLDRLYAENLAVFVKSENPRAVVEALGEKRGVLIITAHLGNWEYLGVLGSRLGYNVATVLKRQHNPYTDRWLAGIREKKGGFKCFYPGRGLSYRIGAHLKQNGILALVADQRDISSPLIVPFFGKPGQTADGPARLHLWYESPIVFAFSIRQPDGTYLMAFDGPYHFSGSGDRKGDCVRIMTLINQKYEAIVGKYPEQWLSLLTPRWEIDKGVAQQDVGDR